MSEVSCRAWSFFRDAAAGGLIDLRELLEGSALRREVLEDPRQRVPWDDWALLNDRFAVLIGSYQALLDCGRVAIQSDDFLGFTKRAAALFTKPSDVYRLGASWLGPTLYRNVRFSLSEEGGRLFFSASLLDGYRGSAAWFASIVGTLRATPRLLGLPDAVVEADISARTGRYWITPPPPRTLFSSLRRSAEAMIAPQRLADELLALQSQLADSFDAMYRREREFRGLLEGLPAVVLLHRGGRIIYANPAAGKALGQAPSTLLGSPWLRWFSALPAQTQSAPVRLAVLGHAPALLEAVAFGPLTFDGGAAEGIFALDVTERERTTHELLRSQDTLDALTQHGPDLVVRLAADGTILDVQGGVGIAQKGVLQRALGKNIQEVAAKFPGMTAEQLARGACARSTALQTGAPQRYEVTLAAPDGPRFFEQRFVPLRGAREGLLIIQDITRRRHEEQQLFNAERLALLGTMSAGVVHDINNPLALSFVNAELAQHLLHDEDALQPGSTVNEDLRIALQNIQIGLQRVQEIVRGLKGFARQDDPRPQPVQLEEALRIALLIAGSEIKGKSQLVCDLAPLPPVLADMVQLEQVLVNLLVNAVQSMPVERPTGENLISIRVESGPAFLTLWVQDNGAGIPAEVLPRIFEPFYTTKPRGVGTGLGLSICRRIARDLGGDVWAESAPGRGSIFFLRLRRASEDAPPP